MSISRSLRVIRVLFCCWYVISATFLHQPLTVSGMKFILVTTMNIHIPSIHIFTAGSFSYSLTCQLALRWTGCPLASLWPEHRTKGWPILVSLKIPTLSHTHKLGQLLGLLKLHLYFYAVQELAWSLSLQTALSLLVSPAGLLSGLLSMKQELLQPADVEHGGLFPEGLSPSVSYLQRQESKTTQPSVLQPQTDWLGCLETNRRRSCDLYTSFSPAPLSRQTLLDLMDFSYGQLCPWELV